MKTFKHLFFVILVLTLLTLLTGCNKNNRKKIVYFDIFPRTISLKCEKSFPLKNGFNPYFMELKDTVLILGDLESDPHFELYSIPEIRYLGSFGNHGKGPTEFLYPLLSGNKLNHNLIAVTDLHTAKVCFLDLGKILTNSGYNVEKSIILPPELLTGYSFIFTDEHNLIYLVVEESKGEFVIYNQETKEVKWNNYFEDYNENKNKMSKELFGEYNSGNIKLKPDGKKFVKSFRLKPILDIYEKNGNIDFSIIRKGFNEPGIDANKLDFDNSTLFYYHNTFLTDKYIYALFENYSISEKVSSNVELHVFSWKGDAVCNYKLNEGIAFISPFIVDEHSKKVYTVNSFIENSQVRVFDIKDGHLSN